MQRSALLSILAVACGCADRGRPTGWKAPISGVVKGPSGEPAAGAIVVLTPKTDGRTEVAIADNRGQFVTRMGAGEYAITASTAAGYAYRSIADVSSPIDLVLDPDCEPVHGTVPARTTGTVRLGRFSDRRGDVFAASIRADHSFSACVPRSPSYYAYADDEILIIPAPLDLPQARPLELAAYDAAAVRTPPTDLSLNELTAEDLIGAIPASARVIALGEATHGTRELQTLRLDLTKMLVHHERIKQVLIEAGYVETLPLDAYIQGEDIDPQQAVAKLGYWMWDTEETLRTLRELRELNRTRSSETRVHLFGFDVQGDAAPAEVVAAHASMLGLSPSELSQVAELAEKKPAPSPEAARTLGAALLAAAERHKSAPDATASLAARQLAHRLLAKSEPGLPGTHERRDQGMADMVFSLADAYGAACVWAHDSHVGAAPASAMTTMGEGLRARLGAAYYAVGYYVSGGSVRAWDAALAIGVITNDLGDAPQYTLEGAVTSATTSPVVYLPYSRASEPLMAWLKTPRYVTEIGPVMRPDPLTLRDLRNSYDAVVIVRDSHPTTPTPTGVRVAKKKSS